MLSSADREIRLGIWKIHILHHAASRMVWGTWLLEELAEHGHTLSPGTLYPALARMERNRWIRRTGGAAHAKARQTFRITPEGRLLLRTLRHEVTELYKEVVLQAELKDPLPIENEKSSKVARIAKPRSPADRSRKKK